MFLGWTARTQQTWLFTTTSRSFTSLPNATFPEASRNGTAQTFTSSLGNGTGFAGKNIWNGGGSGFPSQEPSRENSRPREHQRQADIAQSGSRDLLVDSEPTSAWTAARRDVNGRSFTSALSCDAPYTARQPVLQPLYTGAGASKTISPTGSRLPSVYLGSVPPSSQDRGGGIYGNSGFSGPPAVYPLLKHNSSAAGPIDSPHDESKGDPWAVAAAHSRERSQAPSRHLVDEAWADQPFDSRYAPASSFSTTSRSLSTSSQPQRTSSYSGYSTSNDSKHGLSGRSHLTTNGHASSLRKPSAPANGYIAQRPIFEPSTSRASNDRSRSYSDQDDEIVEIDRSLRHLGLNDYTSSYGTDMPRLQSNERFGSTSSQFSFQPSAQPFSDGAISPRSFDPPNGDKTQNGWPSFQSGALVKQSNGLLDQQAMLDPQFQHMMAMRNPYSAALYNPYAMPGAFQLGGASPYYPFLPMGLPGLDGSMSPRDALISDGVQSTKLYEFKNAGKNNKRYELKDIFDHIAEFAGDQHGSRFIQTKLETANSDEKDRVFREIEPNAIPLMTDVFGNYVIQKFFDHGHQDHKRMLAHKMRGQVLNLSLQMYGCRVVQKALEHVLVEQQAALVGELENHVLKCVKDQNGNHVIQKAIERCPSETIGFIYQAFLGQVQHLSLHPYGCRVIQRCLERPDWFSAKSTIMGELHESMPQGMIADQYGNYVVQHVVEKGGPMDKTSVFRLVLQGLEGYSKHKFASNVVEKCIQYSDDLWRRDVVNVLVASDQRRGEGESCLVALIKDNFGNYVIQKLLDNLSTPDYIYFNQHLQPAVTHAKRTGCGKQLVSIEKKMHRLPFTPVANQHLHAHHPPFSLGMPPTPFASNYGSVANTPPPLTADTQSLQSSTIPSINGDTVEGAHSMAMSRKGSELGSDGTCRY